jgi:hypothetical protein
MNARAAARRRSPEEDGKIDGFRKALGPLVVAAETTRMPMAFTDANDPGHPMSMIGCGRPLLKLSLRYIGARKGRPEDFTVVRPSATERNAPSS